MMAQIFPLHFPARSRARIGGVVMTTLRQIELRCPVCDNEFKSQSVVSTNAFGGKRTDFHERAAGTQPLAYLIHMCSECGYSGGEADFTAPTDGSDLVRGCGWRSYGSAEPAVGDRRSRSATPEPAGVVRLGLPRAEQPVPGVAQSGQDVTLGVQFSVQSCAIDLDIGMGRGQMSHAFRSGDQA